MQQGFGAGLSGRLVLLTLLWGNPAQAADPPPQKPLIWAADAKGGAPYISMDPEHPGQYIGFEVELRDALQEEIGRPIEFKQYSFPKLDSGLLRGDFDFALNGVEATPDRQERFRLSRPYYVYTLQLVCRRDDDRFQSLDDCKKLGVTVGTMGNTAAARLLDERRIEKHTYDDQTTPYVDLVQRRVDAVLLDLPIAVQYTKRDPKFESHLKFVGQPLAPGPYVIAFHKDNELLARQFDTAIEKLISNGTLKRIYDRYELWNDYQEQSLSKGQIVQMTGQTAQDRSFGQYFQALLSGKWRTVTLTLLGFLLAIGVGLPLAKLSCCLKRR